MKAIVFGSCARNEQSKHSDLDLVLIQNTEKRFLDRYENIYLDIALSVSGKSVDLLIYTPEEFEKITKQQFGKRIIRDGVVIYESNIQTLPGPALA